MPISKAESKTEWRDSEERQINWGRTLDGKGGREYGEPGEKSQVNALSLGRLEKKGKEKTRVETEGRSFSKLRKERGERRPSN